MPESSATCRRQEYDVERNHFTELKLQRGVISCSGISSANLFDVIWWLENKVLIILKKIQGKHHQWKIHNTMYMIYSYMDQQYILMFQNIHRGSASQGLRKTATYMTISMFLYWICTGYPSPEARLFVKPHSINKSSLRRQHMPQYVQIYLMSKN